MNFKEKLLIIIKILRNKNFITASIKILTAVLVTGVFIIYVQLAQKPEIKEIKNVLLNLPNYSSLAEHKSFENAYKKISESGETVEISVYKSKNSADEFAIIKTNSTDTANIINLLKERQNELFLEFSENESETNKIDSAKIISINNIVLFLVCDDIAAENAVYNYFNNRY